MKYEHRVIEEKLRAYRRAFPCVVVVGARQVGKSTLLAHLFGKTARTFVFDPVQDLYGARQNPDLFLRNNPPPLILDEIQYAPELVPAIKRAIDKDRRPGQYLVTGSQQWSVMRRLSESLAGRAAIMELSGFSLGEGAARSLPSWLHDWLIVAEQQTLTQDLEQWSAYRSAELSPAEQIWRGSFPEVRTLDELVVPGWFLGYTATYLQRDVRTILETRDEMQFASFLALCAAMTAQEVNFTQWGRDIGLAHTTSRRWLDVLRGTYQWLELPSLTRNAVKRVSQRPKGHLRDTGLACHLLRISSPQAVSGHPQFGALFESLVVGDCLRQIQAEATVPVAWHWRRHSGAEVDLVLERDGKWFPIEVKATTHPTPKDANGITALQTEAPKQTATGVVIHAGTEILRLTGRCLAVPFDLLPRVGSA